MKKHIICLSVLFALSFNAICSINLDTAIKIEENTTQTEKLITNEDKNELENYKNSSKLISAFSLASISIFSYYCLTEKNLHQNIFNTTNSSAEEKILITSTFMLSLLQFAFLNYRINEIIKNAPSCLYEEKSDKNIKMFFSITTFTFMTFFPIYTVYCLLTDTKNSFPILIYTFFNGSNAYYNSYINEIITNKYKIKK